MCRERKIKLTEKELNAKINTAYLEGYKDGVEHAEEVALFKKHTINEIRNIFGFPEISKREEVIE